MAILKFIGICIEVLLIFNLLIIVHELGHFLAAKWRGLYIERFGIWFGKPIWEKKIAGVWYSLGSIPAGGFVKLPQLAPMEALEGQTEIPKDKLKPITALDKIIVAFAGPLFSFGLAIVFAVLVYFIGRPVGEADRTTTIGYVQPGAPADGILQPGDELLAIDGHEVKRWSGQSEQSVTWRIAGGEEETVTLKLKRNGEIKEVQAKPHIDEGKWYQRRGLRQLGVAPMSHPMVAKTEPGSAAEQAGFLPNDVLVKVGDQEIFSDGTLGDWAKANPGKPLPVTVERGPKQADGSFARKVIEFNPRGFLVAEVAADSPAFRKGVQKGDRILKADDQIMTVQDQFIDYIQKKEKQPVKLTLERAGKPVEITVIPQVPLEGGGPKPRPVIGIITERGDGLVYDPYGRMSEIYPGPGEQISDAVNAMVQTFKKITSSKSSIGVQHMGGPVMMMRIYYMLFESPDGWRLVLWFSVILNINLALLNMLPLPVLDGGHIVLAIVEAARRKPVNLKVLEWVQTACALLIISFMLFVTFFDVQDVFGGGGSGPKRPQLKFAPEPTVQAPA